MSHSNLNDLTGRKFGKLTVIERCEDHVTPSGKHMVKWLCKCDCGRIKKVLSTSLKNGFSTSCGCYSDKIKKIKRDTPNSNAEYVIGQQYGLLTIIKETKPYRDPKGDKRRVFVCQCVCGKKRTVRLDLLRTGRVVSCGCLKPKMFKKIKEIVINNNDD